MLTYHHRTIIIWILIALVCELAIGVEFEVAVSFVPALLVLLGFMPGSAGLMLAVMVGGFYDTYSVFPFGIFTLATLAAVGVSTGTRAFIAMDHLFPRVLVLVIGITIFLGVVATGILYENAYLSLRYILTGFATNIIVAAFAIMGLRRLQNLRRFTPLEVYKRL